MTFGRSGTRNGSTYFTEDVSVASDIMTDEIVASGVIPNDTSRASPGAERFEFSLVTFRSHRPPQIPGTDVTIEKGTAVYVSLSGLQTDPAHFPEPDRFDPERFAADRPASDAYLPFGRGPRMCASEYGGRHRRAAEPDGDRVVHL